MDCWEILGLEPEANRKQVKIAYAKLLKQTRPDDDPAGFQQLHKAYKTALQYAVDERYELLTNDETECRNYEKQPEAELQSDAGLRQSAALDQRDEDLTEWSEQQPLSKSERSVEVADELAPHEDLNRIDATVLHRDEPQTATNLDAATAEISTEPTANASGILNPEQRALMDDIEAHELSLSSAWEEFHQQLAAVVKVPDSANQQAAWKFIETMPAMRDLEFRASASDTVFEVVSEVNEVALQKKSLYIKRPILNYLNQQLGWDKKWQHFETHYSRDSLSAVFPYLAEADSKPVNTKIKRDIHYYRRALAFAIDVSLLIAAILAIVFAHNAVFDAERDAITVVIFTLVYFGVIIPLQESSVYQATIGKRLLRLRVINSRGDRLGFFQACWRSVVTLFCCVGFKLVVWLNIILSWWRSELVQDAASRSYVIKG